jgi:hypothetical protein
MSFVEDMFKGGNVVTGLAVGIGAAVVVPVIIPMLRPLAKSVIKAGLIAYDQGRAAVTELNVRTGDIVGEARSEIARLSDQGESDRAEGEAAARRTRRTRPEGAAPA